MTSHVGAELTIDLGAIADNYRLLKKQAGRSICAAAVKANAYGTGVGKVAPVLAQAGCDTFFVATLHEGLELRSILPQSTIYVLNGLMHGTEAVFAKYKLQPVLNDLSQIDAWSDFARTRAQEASPAAIHFDTGINRLGLSPKEARSLIATPDRVTGFQVSLVMSHLASADVPDDPMNRQQQTLFAELLRDFRQSQPSATPVPGSLANSAGTLTGSKYHFDLVRPGVALYGGNPFENRPNPMKTVIHLQGRVLQIRHLEASEGVGYNCTWRAPSPRRIATLDVGYADGYLRAFSNKASAYIDGVEAPLVGRVSMDMLGVDVTDLPENAVRPGTPVSLLGGAVPLDAPARISGLSCYELLTLLGDRYKRIYVPSPEMADITADRA